MPAVCFICCPSIKSGLRFTRWLDNLESDLQGVQTMRLEEKYLPGNPSVRSRGHPSASVREDPPVVPSTRAASLNAAADRLLPCRLSAASMRQLRADFARMRRPSGER